MDEEKQLKAWSRDDARVRIRKYCDYQERSLKDVRVKLINHKIFGTLNETIISELIEEDILNEERYAAAFVRGKFAYNQWGKKKIKAELTFEQVPNSIIEHALMQIDDFDYVNTIKILLQKKYKELMRKEEDILKLRRKLYQHLLQKGYSFEEVQPIVDSLMI